MNVAWRTETDGALVVDQRPSRLLIEELRAEDADPGEGRPDGDDSP